MNQYSQRLNSAMSEAGVSIPNLAKGIEISYQAVRKVLQGGQMNVVNNLKAALFLKVDPNWLASGIADPELPTDISEGVGRSEMYPQRRGSVSSAHVEEARLLRIIWDEHAPCSQAEFGRIYDVGTQPAVANYLTGRTALSMRAAQGFAGGLACEIAEFSPRLADIASSVSPVHRAQIREWKPAARDLFTPIRTHLESLPEHDRVQVAAALLHFINRPETIDAAVAAFERPITVLGETSRMPTEQSA